LISFKELRGESGLVKQSAKDNQVIIHAYVATKVRKFEWFNFDEFLSNKYGPCTGRGIQQWHIIKILQNASKISVAKPVGDSFDEYNNIIGAEPLLGQPEIIEPHGIFETRLNYLKLD